MKKSIKGYKRDSPDKNEPSLIIPSNNITMQNVSHPIIGIDNLGNQKYMLPGEDYTFPGTEVMEIPIKRKGGRCKQLGGEKENIANQNNQPNYFAPVNLYKSVFDETNYLNNTQNDYYVPPTLGTTADFFKTVPKPEPLKPSVVPKPLTPTTKEKPQNFTNTNIGTITAGLTNVALRKFVEARQNKEVSQNNAIASLIPTAPTINPEGYEKYGNPYVYQMGGIFDIFEQTPIDMSFVDLPSYISSTDSSQNNINSSDSNNESNNYNDLDELDLSKEGKSVAIKNNNPGNIVYGKFAKQFGAIPGSKQTTVGDKKYEGDSKYASFPSIGAGLRAMESLLTSKSYSNLPVDKAMNKWVNGDTSVESKYTNAAKKLFGDRKIKELNQQELKTLMKEVMIKGEDRTMYKKIKNSFKQGGEYQLHDVEIQDLVKKGYEIEYLD